MEKDAKVEVEQAEERELSFQEEFAKAEQEVDAEETVEVSSAQKESAQPEETQPTDEETSALEGLDNDEAFNEAKKELETELGGKELTFNQTKKFRKTYYEAKENERQYLQTQKELETLRNKQLSDNEVLGEATKRGLLDREKPQPTEAVKKEELNLDELYLKATPEQREWLDIIKAHSQTAVKNTVSPIQEELNQYKEKFKELSMSQQNQLLEVEQSNLKKEYNSKYGIDYDKDVAPFLQEAANKIAERIPNNMTLGQAGWTLRDIADKVIFDKALNITKKQVVVDTKKLNETKKKANMETEGVQGLVTTRNDDTKSFEEIFSEELEREGISKFE